MKQEIDGVKRMETQPVRDNDLHAYADGQLDPARRIEVEAWLADNPDAAARIEDWRTQADLLHELFDSVLAEPEPAAVGDLKQPLAVRLAASNDAASNDNSGGLWGSRRRGGWLPAPVRMAAAAAVLLMVGSVGGYVGHDLLGRRQGTPARQLLTFAEEAAQAHTFYTADSGLPLEMDAQDPGAFNSSLSERLGKSVRAPDLNENGYKLASGRSVPTAAGVSAQFVYENEVGRRLTLFVGKPHAGQDSEFRFVQRGDSAMFYWVEGALAYALIGEMGRDELLDITKTVYQDLKKGQHESRSGNHGRLAPPPTHDRPTAVQPNAVSPSEPASDTRPTES